jgi:MoxR-like ATPase
VARTFGTESILGAASDWKETCLQGDGSMFSDERVWTLENLAALDAHFIRKPDEGNRTFIEKLEDQLGPAPTGAKHLAAELLWVMMLFPNNISSERKIELVRKVWGWGGSEIPAEHSRLRVFGSGIGSAGMGFNNYRPRELTYLIRVTEKFKALNPSDRQHLLRDPWAFAELIEHVEGGESRQMRHMLSHLLYPDEFERISSSDHKSRVDQAFRELLGEELRPAERDSTPLARDRRLFRIRNILQAERPEQPIDFYEGELKERWNPDLTTPPRPDPPGKETKQKPGPPPETERSQPESVEEILSALRDLAMRIDDRTIRRYHYAILSRGFVILSGVSGSGKSWLAEAYASITGAYSVVVPVAPNWTSNEDLLGYADPLRPEVYHHTEASRFLVRASEEERAAIKEGRSAQQFHLILDEMNLARVEYYFAKFLSLMEVRARNGDATISFGKDQILVPSNLKVVGTVNVDETTHGFADKVYDRAQLIEMSPSRDEIESELGAAGYAGILLELWDATREVAPFAFRVVADVRRYIQAGQGSSNEWRDRFDEQVLQKILPKIRGSDPRVGETLLALIAIAEREQLHLTGAKLKSMRSRFDQHGVASYF